jgi:hypothetical protein
MRLRARKARPSVVAVVLSNQRIGACHGVWKVWGVGRVSQRSCAYVCRERDLRWLGSVSSRRAYSDAFDPSVCPPLAAASPERQRWSRLAGSRGSFLRAVDRRTRGRCYATQLRRWPLYLYTGCSLGLGPSISTGCHAFRSALCVKLPHRDRHGFRA